MIIKNGIVADPASGLYEHMDILVKDGKIVKIAPDISCASDAAATEKEEIIDASGMIVGPGLIDTHVHFRDPGFTYKEDIHTGSLAAAKGGFTTVVCMANTKPTVDNVDTLKDNLTRGKQEKIRMYQAAAISHSLKGQDEVDMAALKEAGACGFTDDGIPLTNAAFCYRAMQNAAMGEIIASALRRGTDPLPAIRVIRDKNLSLQKRRAELLAQLGYPEDYLSEKPRCTLCGDTGYRGDGLCSCLKKYYAQEQIRELSRMLDIGSQSFDTFELDWYSPDRGSLPRSPRENAQRNLNLCRDFAARFRPGRENLLLFGAPGLGKTFLSACIARVVSEDGFSVVYDTAGHVFSQFESAKFRRDDDGDTAGEDVERCMNCDLLILDDLGTEMTTSFVQSALYQLLNGRLLTGRSTVISTNLDPEELGRRYGAPLLSRLEGEYQLLPFVGTDIRRLKRERG